MKKFVLVFLVIYAVLNIIARISNYLHDKKIFGDKETITVTLRKELWEELLEEGGYKIKGD